MERTGTRGYFGKDQEPMSFATNYHRWILSEFEPYLGSTVAEVGAGAGNFSRLLLGTSLRRLYAFEPSSNMYPALQSAVRHDARVTTINDVFGATQPGPIFDSVVYVNVMEHIERDADELRMARQALHEHGHVLIFVPALEWLYSDFDRKVGHIRRYTKTALERLVSAAGFLIIKSRYFDVAGILPWYLKFVLLKAPFESGTVSLYDTQIVPIMRRVEQFVAPPIGKNVLLIARTA